MLHFTAGFGPCPTKLKTGTKSPPLPGLSLLSYKHSPGKAASESLSNLQCFHVRERKRCHSTSNGSPLKAPSQRNPSFLPLPVPAGAPGLLQCHFSQTLGLSAVGQSLVCKNVSLKQLQDVFCYFFKRDEEGTSFSEVAIVQIWLKKVQFVCMLEFPEALTQALY